MEEAKVMQIGNFSESKRKNPNQNRVYDKKGLCPTITLMTGGGRQPMIIDEKVSETERKKECSVNGFFVQAVETAVKNNAKPDDIIDAFNEKVIKSGVSPTITTRPEGKKTAILPMTAKYRIRKLTPKECWRLMGYTDTDFNKASKVVSNSQLYKQAGNAIAKQVLMAIFLQMNIQGIKNWNDRTISERENLAGDAEMKMTI